MSHTAYNNQWHRAQKKLNELIEQECSKEPQKPELDRNIVYQKLATQFVKYVQVFRKLEECYDQIVHPQKRMTLKLLLDGTMGRMLEIKEEMVKFDLSEYQFFDDVLSDLKLTPDDIEIPIPKYFIVNNKQHLEERETLLASILNNIKENVKQSKPKKMSEEQAIKLIQMNERARQGRLRAKFMREIRAEEERERAALARGAPSIEPWEAAIRIQKRWRGYAQRAKTSVERRFEDEFLGMTLSKENNSKLHEKVIHTQRNRRKTQEHNYQEYLEAVDAARDKIRDVEGADMKEAMQDQIRQWFIECRDLTGTLPDYPPANIGGSAVLFAKKTPEEVEEEMRLAAIEEEEKKKRKRKEKNEIQKGGNKGKKGKKNQKAEEEVEPGWVMSESKFLGPLKDSNDQYCSLWKNRDDNENYLQKHDIQMIREEKRLDVEAEIREQVDFIMSEELKNLKLAVDNAKPNKIKKPKKQKRGKAKKAKQPKDLTGDRTVESMYEELVQQGILVQNKNFPIKNYIGEYNYLATTLRQNDVEPQPSVHDVRQLITLYGILPLGSETVHENMPVTKSLLITGPRGVGKKSLVHAICTETAANLFDLTAENLVGKFPGTQGINLLLNMIWKVANKMQPSVIWIDNAHKAYLKKLDKDDKSEPKRLAKLIPKLLKFFRPGLRLLLVGTSTTPFKAKKGLFKAYQRIIMVPRPEYGSRYALWSAMIVKFGGIITNSLNISSLAKMSEGYTQKHIIESIKQVLTEKRLSHIATKPLKAAEFVPPFSKIDPVYKEEEEEYQNWYLKTPMGKKREAMIQELLEPVDLDKDKKKKNKKNKKK